MMLERFDPEFHLACSQVFVRRLGIALISLGVALLTPVAPIAFVASAVFVAGIGLALYGLTTTSLFCDKIPRSVNSQMLSNMKHPGRGFVGGLFHLGFDAVLPG